MKTIIIALLVAFACSAELKVEEEQELMWNPQGLLKCLQEAAPYAKEVIEIINLIRQRNYVAAFGKAMALVRSAVELTVDWIGLGRCLLVFGQAAELGAKLGLAISMLNIPGIIGTVNESIAYFGENVPGQCQRFW